MEDYSWEHGQSVEEVLNTYWKKAEKLLILHQQRKAVRQLIDRKNALVAGIVANTNIDGQKGEKGKRLEEIEEKYRVAIDRVYGVKEEDIPGEFKKKIDKEDPFFGAIDTEYMDNIQLPPGYEEVKKALADAEYDQE